MVGVISSKCSHECVELNMPQQNLAVSPRHSATFPCTPSRTTHLCYLMFVSHIIFTDVKWKAKHCWPKSCLRKVGGIRLFSIISLLMITMFSTCLEYLFGIYTAIIFLSVIYFILHYKYTISVGILWTYLFSFIPIFISEVLHEKP